MPATPWTELTTAATTWTEGISVSVGDAFVLFGLLIPQTETAQFVDATTAYTELSIGATASTELSVAATTWTELTG